MTVGISLPVSISGLLILTLHSVSTLILITATKHTSISGKIVVISTEYMDMQDFGTFKINKPTSAFHFYSHKIGSVQIYTHTKRD